MTYHRAPSSPALTGLGEIPSASQLGRIVARDGWSYQITPNDVLWLGRSVDCEGGNEAATMWTYAQRLAYLRAWPTLAALVRAHSQPVNPIWATADASGCVAHPDRCTASQLARRAQCAGKPFDSLMSRNLVVNFAKANIENPVPHATDFADATVSTSFLNRPANRGSYVVLRDGNWYIAEANRGAGGTPSQWPNDFVTITFDGRVAGPSTSAILRGYAPLLFAGVIAAGGAALYVTRHRPAYRR